MRRATAYAALQRYDEASQDLEAAAAIAPEQELAEVRRHQRELKAEVQAAAREERLAKQAAEPDPTPHPHPNPNPNPNPKPKPKPNPNPNPDPSPNPNQEGLEGQGAAREQVTSTTLQNRKPYP